MESEPEIYEFEHNFEVDLNYENHTMNESLWIILKKEMPKEDSEKLRESDVPKGFEIIGDIAHMNINSQVFPYRYQVGQVVLDKNPKLRTVVCKIG